MLVGWGVLLDGVFIQHQRAPCTHSLNESHHPTQHPNPPTIEPCTKYAYHLYPAQAFDITTKFHVPKDKLRRFCAKVLSMYNDTPFHNMHHAFHVFQNCVKMISGAQCNGSRGISELQEFRAMEV